MVTVVFVSVMTVVEIKEDELGKRKTSREGTSWLNENNVWNSHLEKLSRTPDGWLGGRICAKGDIIKPTVPKIYIYGKRCIL